jgi:hypothetical protein
MWIEMQCENCGEIETIGEEDAEIVEDPEGGATQKGKCSVCGKPSWQINE